MKRFHFLLLATILLGIVAMAACAPAPTPTPIPPPPTPIPPTATRAPTAVPPPASPTTAPAAAPPVSITLTLGPGRDSDQTPATATLTSQGARTEVVLSLKPGAAGVPQPVHIHEGACPGVGPVKFPLTNVVDGRSTTVVDAALKDLLTGGFSINAHESAANAGRYVACGAIPKGAVLALDKGRDADQTPATAVLVSAGAKTDVYVSMKPGPAGVQQPNHIHEGACPGVGAVKFPLSNIAEGKGKTTVDSTLDDLLKGGFSINVHESTTAAGRYVACGAVK